MFNRIKENLARIFGNDKFKDENLTEAEVDMILSEINPLDYAAKLDSLEETINGIMNKVDEMKASISDFEQKIEGVETSTTDALAELETKIGSEMNAIKLQKPVVKTTSTVNPTLVVAEQKDSNMGVITTDFINEILENVKK